MPKCFNDNTRSYNGTEPSPRGLGYCANAESVLSEMEGNDGNIWTVCEDKKGVKRWIKKKDNDPFSLENFFGLKVISPNMVYKYLEKNKILKKIYNEIKPVIEEKGLLFYIVPSVIGKRNSYWSDFPDSYLSKFYGDEFYKTPNITLIFYLDKKLKINIQKEPIIQYNSSVCLDIYKIFAKFIPFNFDWSGSTNEVMKISYFSSGFKCPEEIEIKSNFPQVYFFCKLKTKKKQSLFDKNIFDSKEFINYNDIEKNCNFVDFGYGINDFSGNFYGINDVNLVKKFFEKIKESNKLSFENDNFNLRKINAYLYMTEDDYKNDICINI